MREKREGIPQGDLDWSFSFPPPFRSPILRLQPTQANCNYEKILVGSKASNRDFNSEK